MRPIYLDNNATTPLDPRVFEVMRPALTEHFGNPASSSHAFGWHAEELVNIAREHLANLVNASPSEIIFTSGATESNNLALRGVVERFGDTSLKELSRLVTAKTEHSAVLEPLAQLKKRGFKVGVLRVDSEGVVEEKRLETSLHSDALLCSIMLANNEIGTVQDVAMLKKLAGDRVRYFHCDAAAALGKIPIDVENLDLDLISLSAHKIYGPKGAGALYVKKSSSARSLYPLFHGGGHEQGIRAGTLNVPAIVGFGEAARIAKLELEQDKVHTDKLASLFYKKLEQELGNISLIGSREKRIPGNLNILFPEIEASKLLGKLASKVAASRGSACNSSSDTSSHVLEAIGLSANEQKSCVRFGFGRFTTEEETERAANFVIHAIQQMARSKRTSL